MTIEAKKWSVVQMIARIDNELILDEIRDKIIQLLPNSSNSSRQTIISTYAIGIEDKVDIAKLKKEQNFTQIDFPKMDRLTKEANIEESVEDLLEMLD